MHISLGIILLNFFFSSSLILRPKVAEITVKIHERLSLSCSAASDPENVKKIDWYRCSTYHCKNEWLKYRIALVQNMSVTVPDPNFEVYTNGTLVIKKVLPADDGKWFICIPQMMHVGRERSSTILHIAKEPPQLTRESPPEPQVIEGNDLHLDVRVQGYPYPWVTWRHRDHLLQNKSNVDSETRLKIRNITVLEGGSYTCYAKNPLGHDNLTFDVNVEGQLVRTTAVPDIQTPSSSPTSGLSTIQPRQSSATTTKGASFLFEWDFHLQDEDKIELTGFIFGLWVNGYTTHYLMTVTKEGRVIHNPQLSKKLPGYVGRVTWAGNISKSYLAYKLENLSYSDSNTYGCQIDVGGFRRTIHSMITLNVQAINASKTPEPSVSSIWVHTPNATSSTFVPLLKGGPPAVVRLPFHDIDINDTRFLYTWEYPKDNNGANITMFTVWYRPLLQEKWSKVNVTQNRYSVRLNCCLTYEIMVTAWNKKGQSSFDPRTAGRVTVLKGATASPKSVLENATARSVTTSNSNILVSNGKAGSAKSKWELGVEYLPYLSVLAIPAFLWAVTSKLRRRTGVNKISANENGSVLQYQRVEAETVPMDPVPSWEFRKENLAIERVVGHGAFGVVSKAYARYLQGYSEWTVVAVKSLQEDAKESEREDLLSELNLLKRLKPHPHVIKLLGCITEEKETPYVIIEYVPYGDLLGYLRRSRGLHDCYYEYPEIKPTTNLTSEQIITFAWQIADGMQYISSKRIIHRDLAARNVLVGDNLRCKITDFGMARDADMKDIYIPRNQGRIPVKWTAIEAMSGRMEYSTKSDVWSFGIVLYEICTIGAEPYPGISPYDIPRVLQEGYRIPKPDYFKDELYNIMLNCWETDPEIRPSFESLRSSIRGLLKANQNYVNIQDCLETHQSKISL